MGGPAFKAGIKPDDIIIEMEGSRIESLRDLRQVISKKTIGDTVQVVVVRGREKVNIQVTLAELEVR